MSRKLGKLDSMYKPDYANIQGYRLYNIWGITHIYLTNEYFFVLKYKLENGGLGQLSHLT